ncbi:MAG: DNA-binding response regulator [Calditrichaeota bacterium]|nr:response regulator transcription factor [Anaerolineaceae bacterium]RQV93707.1 MAG: DNA-binding response regulator [Calditrichota bacterium]
MNILLVDGERLFREGLISLLKDHAEYLIAGEAGSVVEAIELAQKTEPDLVLMDYLLPDGTCVDVMSFVNLSKMKPKIVILTSEDKDDYLFTAIRAGAHGYLLKNQTKSNLLASIKALERGEFAISRTMFARVMGEFSKINHPQPYGEMALEKLTRRERDVLSELATNASNREIASHLVISENTVKNHIHSILEKLGIKKRAEVVKFARRYSLLIQTATKNSDND